MANYIKSFNFRNGVQVDNDNFIVNAVGRVGIGTTVPEKLLDVRGNAKIVGHITATDASVSGIVTVGSITINGSTGTISASTFSGSAGNFGDQAVVAIATDGFIAGATGLTTTSNIGIGTDSTAFQLQVGNNPETSIGFGVTSGNVTASGNLSISGISTLGVTTVTDLTGQQLNVSGISTLGVTTTTDLTVSGISTLGVTSVTNLTGQQLNISGVSTFSDDILIGTAATVGFGSTAFFRDNVKAIFGTGEDFQIYHDGTNNFIDSDNTTLYVLSDTLVINDGASSETMALFAKNSAVSLFYDNLKKFETTNEGVLVSGGTTTGALSVSGVSTFSNNILIGTAATVGFGSTAYFRDNARAIFGDSNDLQIYHDGTNNFIDNDNAAALYVLSDFLIINDGDSSETMATFVKNAAVSLFYDNSKRFETTNTGITVTGIGSFTSIGIQTSAPSADLQIRKASGDATLEVISDTASASISIGNSVGAGTSSALINYGSTSGFGVFSTNQSLDIINRDTGNINYFLSNSAPTNSGFRWHKGSSNQLMTLTSDGKLGIGITNPDHPLHVSGISTFTSTVYFGGNASFTDGTTIDVTLKGDVQNTSGSVIVDVSKALLNGNVNTTSGISTFNRVSVSSTISADNLTIGSGTLHSISDHQLSINSSNGNRFYVSDIGTIGISTSVEYGSEIGVSSPDKQAIFAGVGIGTTTLRCAADFADAGIAGITTHRYFLPPKVSSGDRNGIGGTVTGATIYNITLNKLQVYTGSAWETLTSS